MVGLVECVWGISPTRGAVRWACSPSWALLLHATIFSGKEEVGGSLHKMLSSSFELFKRQVS